MARSTLGFSHGKQVVDKATANMRMRGYLAGARDGSLWLPDMLAEYMSRGSQATPGELRNDRVGLLGKYHDWRTQMKGNSATIDDAEYQRQYGYGETAGELIDLVGNAAAVMGGGLLAKAGRLDDVGAIILKDGKPLTLYRGVNTHTNPLKGREGYNLFSSDNPYLAGSYAEDNLADLARQYHHTGESSGGAIYPFHADVRKLVEYQPPNPNYHDFFDFDQAAQRLQKDEALVARGIYDSGPRANLATDPERLWSYKSDIYAFHPDVDLIPALDKRLTPARSEKEILDEILRKKED